jgi:radical SAM protein with 4Fe4S-binding SPASM domain
MSLPFSSLNVDIYGRCNLRCRFCPEGQRLNEQPALRMSFSSFQQWIGPLIPELKQLELFNWGEPFLHEELFEILQWSAERNPGLILRLSTNGTLITEVVAEHLIRSPVRTLTVTIAGLTKENYIYYHGVDALKRVINSLRVMTAAKKRLGSSTPKIRLRYLCFSFNLVSAAEVRRWVKQNLSSHASLIDRVTVREGYLCGSTFSEEEIKEAYGIDPKNLSSVPIPLYPSCQKSPAIPAIRADGAVFPCCNLPYKKEYIVGFLGETTFQEIWNGALYTKFRESLTEGNNPVCKECFLRYTRVPLKLDRHFFQRIHFWLRKKEVAS